MKSTVAELLWKLYIKPTTLQQQFRLQRHKQLENSLLLEGG